MSLVNNWLQWLDDQGRSQADGLRELNIRLGTSYQSNSVAMWRKGPLNPHKEALDIMRAAVTQDVLKSEGIIVSAEKALRIALKLS